MISTKTLLFTIGLLFVLIQQGVCLNCYECDSKNQTWCGEIFKSKNINEVECVNKNCVKVKHPTIGGGSEPITRGCYNSSMCTSLSVCLECDTDLCNAATNLRSTFILSIITCVIFIRYYYL